MERMTETLERVTEPKEKITSLRIKRFKALGAAPKNRCSPEWLGSDFRKMRKVENYATFTTVSLRRSVA